MNSNIIMLNVFNPIPKPTPIDQPKKITQVKLRITACPAIMFANKRIIKANGLVNTPNNSIAGIKGTGTFRNVGT